ncbi:MAG: DUF1638 domain-containing protein [Anaerolineales bacterium]|nr:DUF1638 domain-containing protein [Anaerolineales bacterium]
MSANPQTSPDLARTKVLACATVIEEMQPLMPPEVNYEVFDFGLHLVPTDLKTALQTAIDEAGKAYDIVILGYGLCSMAVVGLEARNCTLVVPKVDDCIAIFLGSSDSYQVQHEKEPGTYYLTKGWIEVSDTLLDEYKRTVERYGETRADWIMQQMLKNYKRLVYIDTGVQNQDGYRQHAQKTAQQFNLNYEEVRGSNALIKKMIFGPWDDEFVVVAPGQSIQYTDFKIS